MKGLDKALRAICDDDRFLEQSHNIIQHVVDDLKAEHQPPSKVERELDAALRTINTLSYAAKQRLSIYLTAVCGDRDKGQATIDNFLLALAHDMPKLEMKTRRCLVGAVYATFIEHQLPIDLRRDGPLAHYINLIIAATNAPWSFDQLIRDTHQMRKERWQISEQR